MLRPLFDLLLDLLSDPSSWFDQSLNVFSPATSDLGATDVLDGRPDPEGEFLHPYEFHDEDPLLG